MEELELTTNDINLMEKKHLEDRIYRRDDREWLEGARGKTTLKRYIEEKEKVEEVKWYRNGFKYSLMMQARSNTLQLGWRAFRDEENKSCQMCSWQEVETLEHFLLRCPSLQKARDKYLFLQLPRQENEENLIKNLLLLRTDLEVPTHTVPNCVAELWGARRRLIEGA